MLIAATQGATMCLQSLQCTNSNIPDVLIWCTGFLSCADPSSVNCEGALGCMDTEFISSISYLDCYFIGGCANVNLMYSEYEAPVYGEFGCSNTNIANGSLVDALDISCDGHQSCYNTRINNGGHDFSGMGSLSLAKSTMFSSKGTKETFVSAQINITNAHCGYHAAYKSTFECDISGNPTSNIHYGGNGSAGVEPIWMRLNSNVLSTVVFFHIDSHKLRKFTFTIVSIFLSLLNIATDINLLIQWCISKDYAWFTV